MSASCTPAAVASACRRLSVTLLLPPATSAAEMLALAEGHVTVKGTLTKASTAGGGEAEGEGEGERLTPGGSGEAEAEGATAVSRQAAAVAFQP
jgi:hypothetical protein